MHAVMMLIYYICHQEEIFHAALTALIVSLVCHYAQFLLSISSVFCH